MLEDHEKLEKLMGDKIEVGLQLTFAQDQKQYDGL